MAKQTIFRGTVANDGTGDNLREGARITNENFDEIYTAFGDGTNLISGTLLTTTNSESVTNKTFDATNTFPTITIGDDTSTNFTLSLGGSFEIVGGSGINTAIDNNRIVLSTDVSIVTETSSDILTNKTINDNANTLTINSANSTITIDGTQATLSNIANSSLDIIQNSKLANSYITIGDDTSTNFNVDLGGSFEIVGGSGINTAIENNRIVLSTDGSIVTETSSDVLTNKTINGPDNTLTNIANGSLANSTITLGSDTINLGDTTTTITGLSLDGTGTIDLTVSGSKARFNFAGFGSLPTAATYEGMFAYDTTGQVPYVADAGGWTRLQTENDSISVHSDVNITGIADGYILQWSSAQARFNVVANTVTTPILKFSDDTSTVGRVNADDVQILGFVGGTNISTVVDDANNTVTINNTMSFTTSKLTGDGSTLAFTINSGRTVDDILVFVDGICFVPTDDYTVSGTTLSFIVAPVSSAEITVRYLG